MPDDVDAIRAERDEAFTLLGSLRNAVEVKAAHFEALASSFTESANAEHVAKRLAEVMDKDDRPWPGFGERVSALGAQVSWAQACAVAYRTAANHLRSVLKEDNA